VTSFPQRTARFGVRTLLIFVAVGLVALPFALLLALVRSSWPPLADLDEDVARSVHSFAVEHSTFTAVMRALSDSGASVVWWVVLGLLVCWLAYRRRVRLAVWVTVTGIGSSLLNLAIKTVVGRTRPVLPDALVHATGKSFPSGHTQAAIVGYGILVLVLLPLAHRWWRGLLVGLAATMVLLIGFSRIALGAHYLSDVVGALVIGSAWLLGTTAAFSAWRRETGKPPVHVTEGLEPERADELIPHSRS
jgi:undecaprenyl-diphosphatase